jgi:prefoldin subunit 5
MAKNLIAGLICLFCINMLFNKAAETRLERNIEELENISIHLQDSIEWKEYWIDSLEKVLHELNTNTNR